jgi:hypothetical protein
MMDGERGSGRGITHPKAPLSALVEPPGGTCRPEPRIAFRGRWRDGTSAAEIMDSIASPVAHSPPRRGHWRGAAMHRRIAQCRCPALARVHPVASTHVGAAFH